MALRIETRSEIIPGYRLLERLGAGGYGEVWKAEAPGGLLKAIKIVHDDLGNTDVECRQRAEQELNALRLVQTMRHPYLLSIDRYDIVEGRLLIVTELADCNLWERFQEFRQRRLPGIPREDLLRYLTEAAEVLDLMNSQHQLQHLDIKPQNLFLVHDHVKVADFGLVRDLTSRKSTPTGGVTPYYAAPETFEGKISAFCDQYSLAVMYQELLTGKRPFQAMTMQQLIVQHLQSAPDLSALPPGDRAATARALAKRPEDRHPSCHAYIRALMTGGAAGPVPTVVPPSQLIDTPSVPAWSETPATQMLFRREDDTPTGERAAPRPAPAEETGDGVLFPTIVIGVGRLGLEVLQRVRSHVVDRVGSMSRLPTLRLLHIDTDPETLQAAVDPKISGALDSSEVLPVRLNRPGHYLKPRRHGRSIIEGWFDPQMLYRIKAGNPLTLGLRPLGRLAFCDHYRAIEQKLRDDLEAVTSTDAMDQAEMQSKLGLRSNRPRVYIVAGLGGGTGSGMFIDLGYAVRHRLRQLGYDQPDVESILLLPPNAGPLAKPLAVGNTYAALTELNHYSTPGVAYTANIDDKDLTLLDQGPPFNRFTVLPLRANDPQQGNVDGVTTATEILWRNLITPFGRAVDDGREQVRSMPGVTPEGNVIAGQTIGMRSLTWPRRQLLDRTARWLCYHVLERWVATEIPGLAESVQQWVETQWQALHLPPESLVARLNQVAEQALGRSAEGWIAELCEPFAPKSRWSRGTYDSAQAFHAFSQIAQVVGAPNEQGSARQIGQVEEALTSAAEALQKDLAVKAAQLAVCLIEQPDFRLSGAETAIACLHQLLTNAIDQYDPIYRQYDQAAFDAFINVQRIIETDTRRRQGADLAAQLQRFGSARLQANFGRLLVQIYTRLRDHIGDSHREIAMCRQRLTHLRERYNPGPAPHTPVGTLLPPGCETIEDTAAMYLQLLDGDGLRDLDHKMQALVEREFTALVHVCQTSSDLMVNLETALLHLARKTMQHLLGETNVTELFLARVQDADHARRVLARAYMEAAPALDLPDAPPECVELLAVPFGKSTEEFLQLAHYSLPNTGLSVTASPDDIVFYREQVTVPLKYLPHLNHAARSAYEQMLHQYPPHTRIDIRQWYQADLV